MRVELAPPAFVDGCEVRRRTLVPEPWCVAAPCPSLHSGQVRLLSSMLARSDLPEELVQRCSLAVSTVDGYQGREADAVIFSAVRW